MQGLGICVLINCRLSCTLKLENHQIDPFYQDRIWTLTQKPVFLSKNAGPSNDNAEWKTKVQTDKASFRENTEELGIFKASRTKPSFTKDRWTTFLSVLRKARIAFLMFEVDKSQNINSQKQIFRKIQSMCSWQSCPKFIKMSFL